MDSLSLCAVASELRAAALGRRLGAVVLPRREQLAVGLGPSASLFVSITGADARVHLAGELPPAPVPEPSLQTHFDSLLRGALVTAVDVPNFDRVLTLDVLGLDRVGRERPLRLIVEVMGKHSACVVVDDQGLIVVTLKPVTSAVNRHRELLPKIPYVPPPGGDRRDPLGLTAEDWRALWPELTAAGEWRDGWRARLFGLSEPLWRYLVETAGLPRQDTCDRLWHAWQTVQRAVRDDAWQSCLVRDAQGVPALAWPLPLPGGEPLAALSVGLAQVAAHTGERARLAQRRGELRALLGRALGRVESQLKGLERTRQRAAHAAAWQHQADLLLSHLHAVEPRADSVQVTDWVNGEPVELTLALDPALSGPRNAEALYERARKARRAAEGAPSREPELGAEHERLTALAARLAAADSLDELDMVAARLDTSGAPAAPRAARPRTERERWLARLERHVSADGYTILVGRNATESEGLLSRIAAPSDLWLHVRGAGSGHVIIRTEGRPEAVPAATLEEAARWAARHSRARHSDLVPVVYTQRRYVTKVTGGAAGKVVYRHEKLILVDPT